MMPRMLVYFNKHITCVQPTMQSRTRRPRAHSERSHSFAALAGKFCENITIFGILLHFRAHFCEILNFQFWWFLEVLGHILDHSGCLTVPWTSKCDQKSILKDIEIFDFSWFLDLLTSTKDSAVTRSPAISQGWAFVEIKKNSKSRGQNWFQLVWIAFFIRKIKNKRPKSWICWPRYWLYTTQVYSFILRM